MILFAYNWRQRSITIIKYHEEPTDIFNIDKAAIPTAAIHTVSLASNEGIVLPSDLLSNEEWVRNMHMRSVCKFSSITQCTEFELRLDGGQVSDFDRL